MHYMAYSAFKFVRQCSLLPDNALITAIDIYHISFPKDKLWTKALGALVNSWYFCLSLTTFCSLGHVHPGNSTSLSGSGGYLLLVWVWVWQHGTSWLHVSLPIRHAINGILNFLHRPNFLLLSDLGTSKGLLAIMRIDWCRKFSVFNVHIDHNQLADRSFTIIRRHCGRGSGRDHWISLSPPC